MTTIFRLGIVVVLVLGCAIVAWLGAQAEGGQQAATATAHARATKGAGILATQFAAQTEIAGGQP